MLFNNITDVHYIKNKFKYPLGGLNWQLFSAA